MSQPDQTSEDPVDVEPTDNSSGAPVDLERVDEIEEEAREEEA